jgi:hypothetical protein
LLLRLTAQPHEHEAMDATEVITFLFDEVYYDFHVKLPATALENYDRYLSNLKATTLEQLRRENAQSTLVNLTDPEVVIEGRFRERARALGVTARLSAVVAFRRELKLPF